MSKFVQTALANCRISPEPKRDLAALVANLTNVRRIRVALVSDGDPAIASTFVAATEAVAPAWFRAIANAPISVVAVLPSY